ncbi:unnamed protein product [Arctogadus glacialis]
MFGGTQPLKPKTGRSRSSPSDPPRRDDASGHTERASFSVPVDDADPRGSGIRTARGAAVERACAARRRPSTCAELSPAGLSGGAE